MIADRWVNIPIKPARFPFFYGWIIVACTSIGIMASIPGQTIGVGVFVDFLVDVIKLSPDNLSLAYLIGTLASSVVMPFAGRLLDRWGARSMGVISSMGLGIALGGFALCNIISPPGDISWLRAMITLCFLFFCIRFFGQGCLTLVSRVMLARWFNYRRGLATSIAGIFVSIAFSGGGAWILNELVVNLGWQGAYVTLCIAIGVGHAIFAWIFFRDNPKQCGLPQDGFNVSAPQNKDIQETAPPDLLVSQAMHKISFWSFNFGLAAHALLMTAIAFHLTAIGAESGLDRQSMYAILLPMPIFSISGSFFCGFLCDRFDQRWALMLMMLSLILGLMGLLQLPSLGGRFLTIFGLGISGGCFGVIST
ncbi:MAG: MFS transporter, partial [Candidatus Hydrogenedentes bacterium]|nr:MFS transporter [Candidatus Hydrogenedentota bacterium]